MTTLPFEFKPSLAIDIKKVKTLPTNLMASEKLDGIRCTFFGGKAYSRSLKLLPNKALQAYAESNKEILERVDCEIIIGPKFAKDVFSQSTSGVMSQDANVYFNLFAFDLYIPGLPFKERYKLLKTLCEASFLPRLKLVEHTPILASEISLMEQVVLSEGAEGLMLRDAEGFYKCGRSGTKNSELMKVKAFVDEEFTIAGFEPKYHNANEAKTNELGRTSRSSHKENLVALDTLGALTLVTKEGLKFNVGTGFDDKLRYALWCDRANLIGKLAKIKHFPIGMVDVPRLPVFIGIRSELDI